MVFDCGTPWTFLLPFFEILQQPLYNSDLAPLGQEFFPIKAALRDVRFENASELRMETQNVFRHTTVTGLETPTLNDYRNIENTFKSAVITLKKYH